MNDQRPQEQVVVTVRPDGTITAETIGIKGSACLDQIALLEDLLEATTMTSNFTHEYHETATPLHDEAPNELRQQ